MAEAVATGEGVAAPASVAPVLLNIRFEYAKTAYPGGLKGEGSGWPLVS